MKKLTHHYSLFIIHCSLFIALSAFSQTKYYDYGFQRNLSVRVIDDKGDTLKYPWAGGMNSCQFSAIDLNQDGIMDLFVFEKNGNRVLTFINKGTYNKPDYIFAPEYETSFPPMQEWAMLVDYNNDGKADIFTYGAACIVVYKNISDSLNGLKFKLMTKQLNGWQNSTYTNIYTSSLEYPAFTDVNNDGVMDILTFYPMGTYVNYLENQSIQKYNNYDSLYFVLKSSCWGNFAVSSYNNKVILNVHCPLKDNTLPEAPSSVKNIEHIGNSLLAIDSKNNGVKDLIVGDFEYPGLTYLSNAGTPDSANIVSQDTSFPSNSIPVRMYGSPVASLVDVDNDGLKDLIVSPFDDENLGDNYNCVWFYKNTGTNTNPVFTFQSENFLQKDMIDVGAGAYPVLLNYYNDSLADLIVANYGYRDSSYYQYGKLYSLFNSRLALFKNTGIDATHPQYTLITNDFANISSLNIAAAYPAFGDIYGVGKIEMLLGNADGSLFYFQNTAPIGQPANFVLLDSNYQNINVGAFSTPQLIDINGDSLLDLVIGNWSGTIFYYKNTGTKTSPQFTLISKEFGGVNVRDTNLSYYGYSVPLFFRDNSGKLKLFVGSQEGYIYYFTDIENNLNGKFTPAGVLIYSQNKDVHMLMEGERTGVAVTGLNVNGYPDLIIGNYAGGLAYYSGIIPPALNNVNSSLIANHFSFTLYPNPASSYITVNITPNSLPATISTKIKLAISNIFGQSVYSNSLNIYYSENLPQLSSFRINTDNLPAGVYICTISSVSDNNFFSLSKKFISVH